MEINTIVEALQKLEGAGLYRTPKDMRILVDPWFSQFKDIPTEQFDFAINEIVRTETGWPAFAIVHQYASIWREDKPEKVCLFCDNMGILLVKTKGCEVSYSCSCPIGELRHKNLGIPTYESLGIPWPETDGHNNYKMGKDTRKRLESLKEYIGQDINEMLLKKQEIDQGVVG